jgi:hypothetical protein
VLDERQQVLDEREHVLAVREARLGVMEKRHVERKRVEKDVLTRGVQRDIMAQGRDFAAAERDMAADMDAWLRGDVDRPAAEARQEALDDRKHAHDDRCSAAADRSSLYG